MTNSRCMGSMIQSWKVSRAITPPRKRADWRGRSGLPSKRPTSRWHADNTDPIKFNGKFEQGEVVFTERRSIFFKKMQIVRGCDAKAKYTRLYDLHRQAYRWLAKKFDVHCPY